MSARAVTAALSVLLGALAWSAAEAAPALPQGPTIAGSTAPPGATFDTSVANRLNVNQSASRVVIDWRSFDIGAGATVNFNQASPAWIAFNRVMVDPATGLSPLSTIDGALNAQGGVWLFSTGGILFGPTAVVNVGAFAGVTGPLSNNNDISQLLNPDSSGLTNVSIGTPIGPGVETITVDSGAQINASSGFVWLQAETMVQDGAITAADGVGYAVAETGGISFTTGPAGQQIVSEGVTVVPGQDRPSFSHGGSTSAAWVGIDTPGGAMQAGYHTLINLGGEITATGIKPGTTDQGVVLLVGGNLGPAYPNYSGSSIGIDASGATINATNGMFVWTDSAKLGPVTLGAPLDVETYGDLVLTAPVSVAAGGVQLNSVVGTVAIDANLTADQSIGATGQTITVGPGVTVRSDALGAANGGIVLAAAGDITADPTSLLVAGPDPKNPTDSVTVTSGGAASGGDIAIGSASGVNVFIHAQSQGVAGEGALTLAGDILGTQSVLAFVDDVTTRNNPTGDLKVLGNVSSPGFVDIENLGTGALIIGPGATVQSGGQVYLTDGGSTSVESGATIVGASLFDHTAGALTIAPGASLSTTGTSPAPAAPVIPAGSEFQRASGLNIAAGTLDIQGAVTAGSAGAPDDIYIEALNATGPAVIGGAGGGPGFNLTNASFAHLSGRDIIIMGGPGEGQGAGVDLTVDDLTLDSSRISALWLGTDSGHSITVAGAITPAGAGPVDVQIGFAREGASPEAGLDGFIPGEIDVTGALGAPNAPLAGARLIARNDILMGAPAFVAAAEANPNFDAVRSSNAFPVARDKVFVAAGVLQMSAQGRILQQNTAPSPLTFAGLAVGAPTAGAPLIAAPAALQGQAIGGEAWTADFAAGPSEIQLFGALAGAGGRVVNDQTAALAPDLLDPAIASRTTYEINSCVFGQVCASPIGSITFQPPPDSVAAAQAAADAGLAAAGVASIDVTAMLPPTSTQQDEDRLGSANPLTETGNGDLWTSGVIDCRTPSDPDRICP